jgi:hypothetical protein
MFPNRAVSIEGRHRLGPQSKVSLYRLFTVGEKHRYIPIVRKGRSWAPKIEPAGTPGSYYLRYLKNGSRTFESVGGDLQVALQELKARQPSPKAPAPVAIITQSKTVRMEVQAFLSRRPKSWLERNVTVSICSDHPLHIRIDLKTCTTGKIGFNRTSV